MHAVGGKDVREQVVHVVVLDGDVEHRMRPVRQDG
ncbi:hypothetical protein SDC9_206703 [bioreactor metagenome]|uniref:Uncharacterized protein n=1 Tax=bioreactor metagenome TaxID=1076179 RepID=A0A645J6A7_9ZZZZ